MHLTKILTLIFIFTETLGNENDTINDKNISFREFTQMDDLSRLSSIPLRNQDRNIFEQRSQVDKCKIDVKTDSSTPSTLRTILMASSPSIKDNTKYKNNGYESRKSLEIHKTVNITNGYEKVRHVSEHNRYTENDKNKLQIELENSYEFHNPEYNDIIKEPKSLREFARVPKFLNDEDEESDSTPKESYSSYSDPIELNEKSSRNSLKVRKTESNEAKCRGLANSRLRNTERGPDSYGIERTLPPDYSLRKDNIVLTPTVASNRQNIGGIVRNFYPCENQYNKSVNHYQSIFSGESCFDLLSNSVSVKANIDSGHGLGVGVPFGCSHFLDSRSNIHDSLVSQPLNSPSLLATKIVAETTTASPHIAYRAAQFSKRMLQKLNLRKTSGSVHSSGAQQATGLSYGSPINGFQLPKLNEPLDTYPNFDEFNFNLFGNIGDLIPNLAESDSRKYRKQSKSRGYHSSDNLHPSTMGNVLGHEQGAGDQIYDAFYTRQLGAMNDKNDNIMSGLKGPNVLPIEEFISPIGFNFIQPHPSSFRQAQGQNLQKKVPKWKFWPLKKQSNIENAHSNSQSHSFSRHLPKPTNSNYPHKIISKSLGALPSLPAAIGSGMITGSTIPLVAGTGSDNANINGFAINEPDFIYMPERYKSPRDDNLLLHQLGFYQEAVFDSGLYLPPSIYGGAVDQVTRDATGSNINGQSVPSFADKFPSHEDVSRRLHRFHGFDKKSPHYMPIVSKSALKDPKQRHQEIYRSYLIPPVSKNWGDVIYPSSFQSYSPIVRDDIQQNFDYYRPHRKRYSKRRFDPLMSDGGASAISAPQSKLHNNYHKQQRYQSMSLSDSPAVSQPVPGNNIIRRFPPLKALQNSYKRSGQVSERYNTPPLNDKLQDSGTARMSSNEDKVLNREDLIYGSFSTFSKLPNSLNPVVNANPNVFKDFGHNEDNIGGSKMSADVTFSNF